MCLFITIGGINKDICVEVMKLNDLALALLSVCIVPPSGEMGEAHEAGLPRHAHLFGVWTPRDLQVSCVSSSINNWIVYIANALAANVHIQIALVDRFLHTFFRLCRLTLVGFWCFKTWARVLTPYYRVRPNLCHKK